MKVRRSIHIEASPDEVYRVVMDPRRLKDWVSIHERLTGSPGGELDAGSKLTQRLKVAGAKFTVRWTVVEDDRPSHVVWEGKGPARTSAKVVYDFAPKDGGTDFSYLNEYEIPGGAAGKLAGKAVSRAAKRETERTLERLKALLEG